SLLFTLISSLFTLFPYTTLFRSYLIIIFLFYMLHTVLSSHMLMWVQSHNGGAHSSLQDYASLPLLVGLHVVHLFHKQEVTAQKEKKKNNETHVHELFFQYVIETYSLFPLQIGIRVRRVLIPFVPYLVRYLPFHVVDRRGL